MTEPFWTWLSMARSHDSTPHPIAQVCMLVGMLKPAGTALHAIRPLYDGRP